MMFDMFETVFPILVIVVMAWAVYFMFGKYIPTKFEAEEAVGQYASVVAVYNAAVDEFKIAESNLKGAGKEKGEILKLSDFVREYEQKYVKLQQSYKELGNAREAAYYKMEQWRIVLNQTNNKHSFAYDRNCNRLNELKRETKRFQVDDMLMFELKLLNYKIS